MFKNAQAISILVKTFACRALLNATNVLVIQINLALHVKLDLLLKMLDARERVQTIILT